MTVTKSLTSQDIEEIGKALYGQAWQNDMAKGIGLPRQSIGYYISAGGASGAQAAAIVGLIARMAAKEARVAKDGQAVIETRRSDIEQLLCRFDPAS